MANYFGIIYWASVVLVLALIFMSVMGSFGSAMFLSAMLMPGILFVKFFAKDISFKDLSKGITDTIYFVLTALVMEYFAIALVYLFLHRFEIPNNGGILTNPVFIWFLLASLLAIEKLLNTGIYGSAPVREEFITFISDRKKVSIATDAISYIESRDTEVIVWTAREGPHPTRMKISQWDAVLDDRFIRVHRSFIVNVRYITETDNRTISLGDTTIDVSRKYREAVANRIRNTGR